MKIVFESLIAEWFSSSPSEWNVVENNTLFKISKRVVGEDWRKFDLLSMGKPGVTVRDMESGKGKFPESFDGYQIVEPGDLIFCLFDMNETPRTVGYSEIGGMITPAYTVMKTFSGNNPKFLYYLYLMIDEVKGLQPYYTGLRNSIRPVTFLGLEVMIPTEEMQDQIVLELDRKISLINDTIQMEKERIENLENLKNSIVRRLVTGTGG